MRPSLASCVLASSLVVFAPSDALAQAATPASDSNLWLEAVTDEKALAWVRERNAVSVNG